MRLPLANGRKNHRTSGYPFLVPLPNGCVKHFEPPSSCLTAAVIRAPDARP